MTRPDTPTATPETPPLRTHTAPSEVDTREKSGSTVAYHGGPNGDPSDAQYVPFTHLSGVSRLQLAMIQQESRRVCVGKRRDDGARCGLRRRAENRSHFAVCDFVIHSIHVWQQRWLHSPRCDKDGHRGSWQLLARPVPDGRRAAPLNSEQLRDSLLEAGHSVVSLQDLGSLCLSGSSGPRAYDHRMHV